MCKTRGDLIAPVDGGEAQKSNHKGTGFVRFVNQEDAEALCTLSKNLEDQLTEQHKEKEKKSRKGASEK